MTLWTFMQCHDIVLQAQSEEHVYDYIMITTTVTTKNGNIDKKHIDKTHGRSIPIFEGL